MSTEELFTARLDRIEEKIDKLSEAMVAIARAETKIVAMTEDQAEHTMRLNSHSARMDRIEEKVNENARTVAVVSRIFWITFATSLGAVIAYTVNNLLGVGS
jgi:hypothetical protein